MYFGMLAQRSAGTHFIDRGWEAQDRYVLWNMGSKKDAAFNSCVLIHIEEVAVEFEVRREAQQCAAKCVETIPGPSFPR